MEKNTEFNEMQMVKRRMFAMRNGVIADTLRRAGVPFRIIFGLNLPQIVEVAKKFGPNRALAEKLWANTSTRESMLLAPMLMPADDLTIDEAMRWISQVPSVEVADILCHRLLRHMPYAMEIVDSLCSDPDKMVRYTALRLMCNIMRQYPERAAEIGQAELQRTDTPLRAIANRLLDL